jgi:hypothetical protein
MDTYQIKKANNANLLVSVNKVNLVDAIMEANVLHQTTVFVVKVEPK